MAHVGWADSSVKHLPSPDASPAVSGSSRLALMTLKGCSGPTAWVWGILKTIAFAGCPPFYNPSLVPILKESNHHESRVAASGKETRTQSTCHFETLPWDILQAQDEDLSLDPQHPHTSKVQQPVSVPQCWGAEAGRTLRGSLSCCSQIDGLSRFGERP